MSLVSSIMGLTYIPDLSYPRIISSCIFLIWYLIIILIAYNGFWVLINKFKSPPNVYNYNDNDLEPVTIIRPIKNIDSELSSCLESSFLQNYPPSKIQILFCIDDPNDPSIPIIKSLIEKYPQINSKILLSSNFDPITNSSNDHYGPNPKVNNLAKGYSMAAHDLLWIMDSNVWASPNILKNSVHSLIHNTYMGDPIKTSSFIQNTHNGNQIRKVKLVHHVPLALSVSSTTQSNDSEFVLSPFNSQTSVLKSHSRKRFLKKWGAKLDEMFLLTSHLKFYIALNNASVAPCVNGKSNLYRKSDLDNSVSLISSKNSSFFNTKSVKSDSHYYSSLGPGNGLKFFARYIGEDNMIAIALWEFISSRTSLTGDFVIQPLSGHDNSINDYMTRRIRWLRVRKYMVLMATLIEPSTESLVCGIFGTYAISSLFFGNWFNWKFFSFHILIWLLTDYKQYYTIINNISSSYYNISWLNSKNLPPLKRSFLNWFFIWCTREILALPIWIIAMLGHEIDWRGRPFKIKKDLTAEEL